MTWSFAMASGPDADLDSVVGDTYAAPMDDRPLCPGPPTSIQPRGPSPSAPTSLMMRLNEAGGDPIAALRQSASTTVAHGAATLALATTLFLVGLISYDLLPPAGWPLVLLLGFGFLGGSGYFALQTLRRLPHVVRMADGARWFHRVQRRLGLLGLELQSGRGLPVVSTPDGRSVDVLPLRTGSGLQIVAPIPALARLTLWPDDQVGVVPDYGFVGPARRAIRELTPARRAALALVFADGGGVDDGLLTWRPSAHALEAGALPPMLDLLHAEPTTHDDAPRRSEAELPWRIACLAVRLSPARPAERSAARAEALADDEPLVHLAAATWAPADDVVLPRPLAPQAPPTIELACQIALTAPALGLGSAQSLAMLAERVPGSRRCVLFALVEMQTPPAQIDGIVFDWLPAEGPLLSDISAHLTATGDAETLGRIEALPRPLPPPLAAANAAIRGRLYPDGAGGLALSQPAGGQLALLGDTRDGGLALADDTVTSEQPA